MNITKAVEKYITEYPGIKDCLKKGLINYSALSRKILKETQINKKNFDAVLIACRRFSEKLREKTGFERQIINLLRNSKMEIKTRVAAVVVEKNIFFNNLIDMQKKVKKKNELFHIVEGANAITIITNEDSIEELKKLYKHKIIRINKNLAELTVRTSEDIEDIPGVVAYLYSLFSEKGINIVETMSCWTDTIFVIEEKDLANSINMLSFK